MWAKINHPRKQARMLVFEGDRGDVSPLPSLNSVHCRNVAVRSLSLSIVSEALVYVVVVTGSCVCCGGSCIRGGGSCIRGGGSCICGGGSHKHHVVVMYVVVVSIVVASVVVASVVVASIVVVDDGGHVCCHVNCIDGIIEHSGCSV